MSSNNKSPFPPGTHICTYLRDSGHEDQELSIPQQMDAIRTWCEENGLILTKAFVDEARPGTSTVGRDQFDQMIKHFRNNAPEAGIVLWKYNRFARDIDDAQFFRSDLRRRGYLIHSINDNIPDGPDGRFFEAAIDWMNQRYIEDMRVDIKRGQRHLLEQYGALGGFPPRGFKREPIHIGTRRDGRPHIVHRWVPDPEWWDRCKRAWEMRARGEPYNKINQICGLFKSLNSYTTYFTNRLYLGELHVSGHKIENYTKPMIDQDTWNAVQEINKKRKHLTPGINNPEHPRRHKSDYILSGILFCAKCGAPLNGETIQTSIRKNGKKYTHKYYICSRKHRRRDCTARAIPQKPIETAVIKTLLEYILEPGNIKARHHQYQEDVQTHNQNQRTKYNELTHRLKGIQTRIENIANTIAEGHTSHTLLKKLNDLEREEIQVITERSQIEPDQHIDPSHYTLSHTTQLINQTREILQDPNANQRPIIKNILAGLINRITAEYDKSTKTIRGYIYYYYPPQPPEKKTNFTPMVQSPAGVLPHRHKKTYKVPILTPPTTPPAPQSSPSNAPTPHSFPSPDPATHPQQQPPVPAPPPATSHAPPAAQPPALPEPPDPPPS